MMVRADPKRIACLTGISPWKRERIKQLLGRPDVPVIGDAARAVGYAASHGGIIAYWASRMPASLENLAEKAGVELWQIEDGFIRSSGLGAALVLPSSIVLDGRGIYYDPTSPSDLEVILEQRLFSKDALVRAKSLIQQIVETGVTKYNLGGQSDFDLPKDRPVALILGQVSDDRSVLLGGGDFSAQAIIRQIRQTQPDTFIVYKPHPDVVAGLRKGEVGVGADTLLSNCDLNALIARVDSVHTLSSLAGFEALLRQKAVHVYGQPFYAGWGLTHDHGPPLSRRTTRLTREELVAGALITYPFYGHPKTGEAVSVETLVAILKDIKTAPTPLWRRVSGKAALAFQKVKG
jgi:capsular polysaccharide export protein